MTSEFIKFEDNDKIIRDKTTKAVLVTDGSALKAHLRLRDQMLQVDKMDQRINSLEEKMDILINLIRQK